MGLSMLISTAVLAGCSSSYLDVDPITNIPVDKALSSPDGCELAVQGIYESMNKQYAGLDWNGNTGEAYVSNVCNDALGPDLVSGLWGNYNSFGNWQLMSNDRAFASCIGWTYYYTIISQANRIINAIHVDDENAGDGSETEEAVSDEDTRAFKACLAQALTMRAHGYQKVMALYGQRYEDSQNGEALGIVLRLDNEHENVPLAKYKDVFALIYSDLDRALRLFEESGFTRANKVAVDASVAHGIYARAALMNHDWQLAQQHASAARKDYTVMDEDTYLSGFTYDCDDYIWHMDDKFNTTYYWSWGSHNCCNGGYVPNWGFGAGAINIDLYNQTDVNDIRRKCYVTPDKLRSLPRPANPGNAKPADFYSLQAASATGTFINLTTGSDYSKGKNVKNALYTALTNYLFLYAENTFKGNLADYASDDNFYNYQTRASSASNAKYVLVRAGIYAMTENLPFGAQLKFWGQVPYGNLAFPWMRASEMVLAEAEAYYEMGDETNAKKCLTELMSKRVSGYACKTSGEALRDEIRINRRMELFMEGQNFTDCKRWNMTVERRSWVNRDETSGNATGFQVMPPQDPSAQRGWRWMIPYTETQYNTAIDKKLLQED